jgi:two-component system, sensor histidine kinase and response regulator
MRYFILIPVMALALFLTCRAQSQPLESLFKRLDSEGSDSVRVLLYYSISRIYWERNADSVLLMSEKAKGIAEKIHYQEGIALADLSKGVAYDLKEDYPEALNCYLQALRISERLGKEGLKANLYTDIGIVYAGMGNNDKAKEYYLASLQIAKKNGDKGETAILLINLAETFKKTGAYDSAIAYNNIALPIERALKDSSGVATILLNIGDNYNRKDQPENGLGYFRKCIALAERVHDDEDIAWAYLSTAQAYLQEDKAGLSIRFAGIALETAKRIAFTEIIKESYSVLYSGYRRQGNFAKALDYRNLEIALKDSIYTIDKDKKIKNLESGYELEKKQHEIDLLNKDNLIQQQDIASERQKHLMFIAGALFFGIGAFFLFRSNQEKERLNRQLKAQNQEILRQNEALEGLSQTAPALKTEMKYLPGDLHFTDDSGLPE